MFDFSGKVALITGAASGIGKATTEYFYACGANILIADIDKDRISDLANHLDPSGNRIAAVEYDAGDPDSAQNAVSLAHTRFGGIDQLVVSAAIYEDQSIEEMTDAQWRRMISVNLDGVFYITKRAIPFMRDGGAIVTLASTAAHQGGSAKHVHYGATKGGVIAYSRGLARELAPRLRVNSVSPGTTETPMTASLRATRSAEYNARTPLGRFGKPAEIASTIAFLCSDAASYVTGETIIVSGGMYMA